LFDLQPGNGTGGSVSISLRGESITGPILGTSDAVSLPDGFGNGSRGFVNFFFATPVQLTPGTTYYFQPVVQSDDTFVALGDRFYNYSGGNAYLSGVANATLDLWFREGIVDVQVAALQVLDEHEREALVHKRLTSRFARSSAARLPPVACQRRTCSQARSTLEPSSMRPGVAAKRSQIDSPRPSASLAPSTWKAEVAVTKLR
jgi:hypothetical protein